MFRRNFGQYFGISSCALSDGSHLLFVFDFAVPALDDGVDGTHVSHVTLDQFPLNSILVDALSQELVLLGRPLGEVVRH